jgi:hypothetical protein
MKWMYPLPFNTKHQYVSTKRKEPGTGLWLLKDPRFITWTSTRGSFLWLHGIRKQPCLESNRHFSLPSPAGSGKTVLTCVNYDLITLSFSLHFLCVFHDSSTVIDAIQPVKSADDGFAYFYFDFIELKTRHPKYFLRSLLAQLFTNQPVLIQDHFSDLVQRMIGNHEPPSDSSELVGLIGDASRHFNDVTLVIDALDEFISREELLPLFEPLRAGGNIRILVTSRKERDIRDTFRDQPEIALEGEEEHVQADMEKHVNAVLESGQGFSKIPQRMKDIILRTLLQGAHGMYVCFFFGTYDDTFICWNLYHKGFAGFSVNWIRSAK